MIIISLLWYLVFGYGCLKIMFIHSLIQNASHHVIFVSVLKSQSYFQHSAPFSDS